jgi:hypothetical protein
MVDDEVGVEATETFVSDHDPIRLLYDWRDLEKAIESFED